MRKAEVLGCQRIGVAALGPLRLGRCGLELSGVLALAGLGRIPSGVVLLKEELHFSSYGRIVLLELRFTVRGGA